jgi:hypothetical protein
VSPYDKADRPSQTVAGGEYVKVSKENKFDSELFKAACIVMVLGWPWVAFALAIWGVPGTWEMTLSDGNHHGGPINWGMGFVAILLTGLALYPWCYSTLLFTWAIRGKPNKARAAEQIGGIHLTHFGLIWFWLTFVGPGVYMWWGGMFGIGMEPEGWYWALFIPSLLLTGIAVQGLFWGLYLLFRGTPAARDQSETQSKLENRIIEQATKSGEVVTKPLKNWWED